LVIATNLRASSNASADGAGTLAGALADEGSATVGAAATSAVEASANPIKLTASFMKNPFRNRAERSRVARERVKE
jgi:hypothetical protein